MKVRVPVFFYLPGFGKSKNPPYHAGETSQRNARTEEDVLPMLYKKPREGFYHKLFTLLLPIVIQNLITSAVSMADVVMLGQVN